MRCPRLTSHPIPWPVHSPPRSGRSGGRMSSVGRLCHVAQRAIALFSLACSTAQPCAPRSSLLFSAAHCPKTEEEEEKKDSEPRSHHPHPAQSIPEPTKGGFERKHTSFFLICPREPTLNKVIDHFCHFAWGGLGEQNVSLSSPPTGLTASFITVAPRLSRSKSGRCCILQGSSPASVRDACVRAWYGIGGKVP